MAVEESSVEIAKIFFCFHLNIVSVVGAHGEGGVGGGKEGVSPRPPHHLRHRLQLRPSSQTGGLRPGGRNCNLPPSH